VDADHNVLICDGMNGRLRRVSGNGIVTTVSQGFVLPLNVAVTSAGQYIVNDQAGRRIYKPNGATNTAIAGANNPSGFGDKGAATEALLLGPAGVAVDRTSAILIADQSDGRVRRVDAGGAMDTIAGLGAGRGNSGDGGLATAAGIAQPRGLAVDPQGNTYVTASRTVRRIDRNGIISTYAGNEQLDSYLFNRKQEYFNKVQAASRS